MKKEDKEEKIRPERFSDDVTASTDVNKDLPFFFEEDEDETEINTEG
jgi:hypothetical protein